MEAANFYFAFPIASFSVLEKRATLLDLTTKTPDPERVGTYYNRLKYFPIFR
jgi:hypothetical protein